MGSYSRSFIIGSIVGLIGIGICLAIEQRWRNMVRRQSGCVQPRATSSESVSSNPHLSSERSIISNGFTEDKYRINSKTEAEDDVIVLFGPVSNMSMHDKSSPGLPAMNNDQINEIHFMKEDDVLTQSEYTIENTESSSTISTKRQNGVETDDNSPESSLITKTHPKEEQPNEKAKETIENQIVLFSAPIMEEADISNTQVQQCNDSLREKKDAPDLSDLDSHGLLTGSKLKSFQNDTRSQNYQHQNDNGSPVFQEYSVVGNLQDCQGPKVEAEPNCPSPTYPVESAHTSFIHGTKRCTEEPTEDKNISSSFTSGPPGLLTGSKLKSFQNDTRSQNYQHQNDNGCPVFQDHSFVGNLQDCQGPKVEAEPNCPSPSYPVEPAHTSFIHCTKRCTEEPTEDKNISPSFTSGPPECLAPNGEAASLKTLGNLKKESVQNKAFANEDRIPEVHLESQRSNFKDLTGLVGDTNNVDLAGHGDIRYSFSEEIRLAQSVKDSLQEALVSNSSVPQTPKDCVQDSPLEEEEKEYTKCDIKLPTNRTMIKSLPYTDLAAIPKKKMKDEANLRESKEDAETGNPSEFGKDEIRKSPKKHRVRKLVGFFENKIEKP